jgi:peptidoglycan/xylan/chitin deacetylase (PgdA/CDA1 family)
LKINKSRDFWQQIIVFVTISAIGVMGYIVVLMGQTAHKPAAAKNTANVKPAGSTPSAVSAKSGPLQSKAAPAQPAAKVNCKKKKCIALTFDDGPGFYESKLVKILQKYNARATFFMLGGAANARKSAVKKIYQAGFEIGNHTWDHKDLQLLSKKQIRAEVGKTDRVIQKITGSKTTLFRPPYGAVDKRVAKAVGKPIIKWNVDTDDWLSKNPKKIYKVVKNNARRGAIVLMHSIYPTSIDAVPKIVRALQKKHYVFVTVSELLGGNPKNGKVYSHG